MVGCDKYFCFQVAAWDCAGITLAPVTHEWYIAQPMSQKFEHSNIFCGS